MNLKLKANSSKLKATRGFTLIELLVVIAIIAILSTIVITFLGGARAKSRDAAVKQQLNSLKTEIEITFGSTGLYGDGACGGSAGSVCSLDTFGHCALTDSSFLFDGTNYPKIESLVRAAYTAAGGAGESLCKVNTSRNQWASAVQLPTDTQPLDGQDWWCVDGSNNSRMVTVTAATAGGSPFVSGATTATCI